MRKQEEINRAAAILRKKSDRISVAQAEVLEQRRTETQLFKEFVVSAGEDKKDDKFFMPCVTLHALPQAGWNWKN